MFPLYFPGWQTTAALTNRSILLQCAYMFKGVGADGADDPGAEVQKYHFTGADLLLLSGEVWVAAAIIESADEPVILEAPADLKDLLC